jgi:biopolymer transport protein ExbB/TolQ
MNCTAFGLIAAIISLTGFAIMQTKTQALEDDINEASVTVLNSWSQPPEVNLQGLENA